MTYVAILIALIILKWVGEGIWALMKKHRERD